MRTTLVLEDDLIRRAKRRAADSGLTLSEVVNNALRETLARPEKKASRFDMITYGKDLEKVRHEPSDFAEASEHDDRATIRR